MKLNAEQVVVVTGGASGIGLACVLAFIEAGCKVVVADLNEEAGQRLAKQHQQVRFFKTNVVDEENVKQLIEFTVREFGKVTVALNCAGIATAGAIASSKGVLDTKILMRTLQINVVGTINVCKFAAAAMLKNEPMGHYKERGVLINISSVAGFEGQRGQVPYAASKGAINAITLPMARDLGRFGIRVVTVAPGIIETPMADTINDKYLEALKKASALERIGKPEEIAQVVTGLCMNSYITGEIIRVDGGTRFPHL